MRRITPLIVIISFFILWADLAHAAGVLMRIQQMKSQRQQPSQAEYEEYQQRQAAQAQGAQGEQGQQQAQQPLTYQQIVDQRNQAIAQAITNANNPSVSTANIQVNASTTATGPLPVAIQSDSTQVKDTVDLSEVWKKLDKKSTVWTLLIDQQSKVLTVSEYIDRFHKEGVKINGSPTHYVEMIDQIVQGNPAMLDRPFGELLQISAIVDYDFDNGMNKDDLARKVLGDAGYEQNKKRFTQSGAGA